jgi:flagellar biogenesis protein FliO
MLVTLIVGTTQRDITADTTKPPAWHDDPRYQDNNRPPAPDEEELLEQLTRICRGILIDDAPPSAS